ncbi:tetratricopeptide repeat protein [Streptomyces xanthii]|uniref:Tetratricopeptide repeat protein n=1 Tax=Streptomyces xanthii TaxID=2768069 RepID=A0A7H1BHF7_9ACTN|nr:tetratricopeptide repeat protein [Streptomyces xanthii]QNS08162.1 tetratricopeptide repeat protein [Streptomyces xanthii]
MDVADLDHRTRTESGCIPPGLVSRLLERGHAEAVARWAGRGEWFCAREWARLLGEQGRRTEALEVVAPYAATGWWPAITSTAGLLESWGRAGEAIASARTAMEEGRDPLALAFYARLLHRHGRGDEAFELLRPHIDEHRTFAVALVDVAEGAGRHEEAAELLAARVPEEHRCDGPWCCRGLDPDTAIGLLATIRERQGRVDEAIALLRTRNTTSLNGRDQLADLLARHDRTEQLHAYAAADELGHVAQRLAELLEERGDVAAAVAVYRQARDTSAGHATLTVELAHLLARHHRADEAIEMMRDLAEASGADDWILDVLCTLYADHGRPEDGLAHLDAIERRSGEAEWELFRLRLPLMAACDRIDQALVQARAHPEGDTSYAASHLAAVLAAAGRTEEAVVLLRPHASANSHDLAAYLIELGRVDEAVTVLHQDRTGPPRRSSAVRSLEPPF